MSYQVSKDKVLTSLIWKLLERGTYVIQFIVTLILARLLNPEDFGLILLVSIFISISLLFVQNGFSTALIQKKDADELDFSSVFYLNLFIASLIYLVIFYSSTIISTFFDQQNFKSVLRILSLTLFLGAFNSIQTAMVSRNMQFKKLFLSSLLAIIISGILGIYMAKSNYGIWSLVLQQISNQYLVTIILFFTLKWRPRLIFSFARIKSLFFFSWKLLASSLLITIYSNIQNLIIGKIFNPAILAYYNRGEQFPSLIVNNLDGSIQSVMLPTLSASQNDRQKVKIIVSRAIVTSSFIIFPLLSGLAVISEPIIKILLTDKWLPAVPFIQLFCVVCAFWPFHTANIQAINAIGRSDLVLKIEIIRKIVEFILLIISIPFGIYAIVFANIISSIFASIIYAYPNKKLFNYSVQEQFKDIMPSLFLSLLMSCIIYTIYWFELPVAITIVIQFFLGITLYFGIAKILNLECFNYLLFTLKELLLKKKKTHLKINNEL